MRQGRAAATRAHHDVTHVHVRPQAAPATPVNITASAHNSSCIALLRERPARELATFDEAPALADQERT